MPFIPEGSVFGKCYNLCLCLQLKMGRVLWYFKGLKLGQGIEENPSGELTAVLVG